MGKTLDKILQNNIPEFLQNRDSLMAYLEAAGIFLQGTKDAITNFDWSHDYQNGSAFNLQSSLEELGFEIPVNLAENLKRLVLRDAIEIFIKSGTEDSLVWVLKMLGLDPDVRYAWLPSPADIRKGYKVDPVSKERTRYDINKFVYTDFLYGEEVVTEDGVFFEGFRYADIFEEELISDLPILGESYEQRPTNVPVARTPYAVVRIGNGSFDAVTDPYTDPNTGEVFEYTDREEFQVINELLEYFLFQAARPTTVKVIIVVSLQQFDDEISIDSELEQDFEHAPVPEESDTVEISDEISQTDTHEDTEESDDLYINELYEETINHEDTNKEDMVSISEEQEVVGVVDVSDAVIGDAVLIGFESPYQSQHSITNIPNIGESLDAESNEIDRVNWSNLTVTNEFTELDGSTYVIPMRGYTDINFTAPSDTDILVFTKPYFYSNDEVFLETVLAGQPFSLTTDHTVHGIRFESVFPSSEVLSIQTVYKNVA